jgi:hypothetical protein
MGKAVSTKFSYLKDDHDLLLDLDNRFVQNYLNHLVQIWNLGLLEIDSVNDVLKIV